MLVELHMIQSFPPSCLNRDDTNTPKDCMFGGVRRARVSSQCWKRAVRERFDDEAALNDTRAMRTKRLVDEVAKTLKERGREGDDVARVIEVALGGAGISLKEGRTEYLLFLPRAAAVRIADVVETHFDELLSAAPDPDAKGKAAKTSKKDAVGAELKKELEAALYGSTMTPELALFGRMVADKPAVNIDAAAQVAHAISTNAVAPEFDFYTAVDDLKTNDEDAGADMMGTIGFSSPCFYRYSVLDTDQLAVNLAGGEVDDEARELAATSTAAFIRGMVKAIPRARQNSFAAHTLPAVVLVVVRDGGTPVSLANAFETPIRPSADKGVVASSIEAMGRQWKALQAALGDNGATYVGYVNTTPSDVDTFAEALSTGSVSPAAPGGLDTLVDQVEAVVRRQR